MSDEAKKKAARRRKKRVAASAPIILNRGEQLAYERALRALSRDMVVSGGNAMLKLYRDYQKKIEDGIDVAAEAVSEAVALELAAMWDVYAEKFAREGGELATAMVSRQTALALRSARKAAAEEAEKIKAMPLFEEITALVTEIKNKIAKLEEIKMAAEYLLAPPDPFNVPILPPEATAYRSEAGIKSLAAEIDLLKEILYC